MRTLTPRYLLRFYNNSLASEESMRKSWNYFGGGHRKEMVVECGEEDGEHGEVGKAEWMRTMECVWYWNGTCKIKAQRRH